MCRSCCGNFCESSFSNAFTGLAIDSSDPGCRQVTNSPTTTAWFSKFMAGLGLRMEEICKPNLALATGLTVEMLAIIKEDISDTINREERFDLIIFGARIARFCVLSSQGSERLMLDLTSMLNGMDD